MAEELMQLMQTALVALATGYVVVAFSRTLSVLLIQMFLVKKHGFPLSGYRWHAIPGIFLSTFVRFLLNCNTNYIACKLDKDKGGFIWRGTFNWAVW